MYHQLNTKDFAFRTQGLYSTWFSQNTATFSLYIVHQQDFSNGSTMFSVRYELNFYTWHTEVLVKNLNVNNLRGQEVGKVVKFGSIICLRIYLFTFSFNL
jgi:hypothetical protein